ncbi:hypothetical protein ACWFNS_05775 [Oerskovia enterophila]
MAPSSRTVVGNVSVSLDGRINGPGGEDDMGWVAPHAVSDAAFARRRRAPSGAGRR